MKDFFREYHQDSQKRWAVSGILSLFLAGGIVNLLIQWTASLQSDLTLAGKQGASYTSDLVLDQSGSHRAVVFGSQAHGVDTIRMTILADTTQVKEIKTNTPEVSVTSAVPWVYLVQADMRQKDLSPWDKVTTIEVVGDPDAPLTLVDTTFTSSGQEFDLTNQTTELE